MGCNTPEENAADMRFEEDESVPLTTYFVTWEIEVDALNHRAAAELALRIQRDATSMATVFKVAKDCGCNGMDEDEYTIDLNEPEYH